MQTVVESGKVDRDYSLYTNDPDHPVIDFSMIGSVVPLPDWISRVSNANILSGSPADSLTVWPTAEPHIHIAKDETLRISLRVTAAGSDSNFLSQAQAVVNEAMRRMSPQSVQNGNASQGAGRSTPPSVLPGDKLVYHIRQGLVPDESWIDIDIGPLDKPGQYTSSLSIPSSGGKLSGLKLNFDVWVVDDDFIVAPASLDLGEVQIPDTAAAGIDVGQLGLRRTLRPFRIKEIVSSIPFLKALPQAIGNGRNYYIRLKLAVDPSVKAGPYQGTIRVMTDDRLHPVIEVPVKLTLTR